MSVKFLYVQVYAKFESKDGYTQLCELSICSAKLLWQGYHWLHTVISDGGKRVKTPDTVCKRDST